MSKYIRKSLKRPQFKRLIDLILLIIILVKLIKRIHSSCSCEQTNLCFIGIQFYMCVCMRVFVWKQMPSAFLTSWFCLWNCHFCLFTWFLCLVSFYFLLFMSICAIWPSYDKISLRQLNRQLLPSRSWCPLLELLPHKAYVCICWTFPIRDRK